MITFNTEAVDKEYLCYRITQMMTVIQQWSQGTCHKFIDQAIIAQILSGAVNQRGQMNKSVLL